MVQNRHSIRLKNYDYSQSGLYFITICTQNRECILGEIIDGKMKLNAAGKIIESIWKSLPKRFPVVLDEYQIMPNHLHEIIVIESNNVGAGFMPARDERATIAMVRATTRVAPTTIGYIIGAFKSLTTHE